MPGKSAKPTTAKRSTAAKGRTNSAFMKPLQPDEALAAVIGGHPLPRTEVTKKIWEYIRKHKLQDPDHKQTIRADDKLRPIFGGKAKVTMFELPGLLKGHLKDAK
jgi:upstream activation factor subunit UAF30